MTAMEMSTAVREGLPVKFFILDDHAYHYMQVLQEKAYRRTTATILARLDYAALAKAFGVEYMEINGPDACGRHPRRIGAAGAGADARCDRLRQATDPLARRGADALHRRPDERAEGALSCAVGSAGAGHPPAKRLTHAAPPSGRAVDLRPETNHPGPDGSTCRFRCPPTRRPLRFTSGPEPLPPRLPS